MTSSVRRVIPDMEKEILEIMKKEGVNWSAAMKLWYNRVKGNNITWKKL